jgi:DNA-binding NarL/FixJ family response regulator
MPRGKTPGNQGALTSSQSPDPYKIPDRASKESLTKSLTKTRVLLVHYIGFVRCGVRWLMSSTKRFEVCAETNDAHTARELFQLHRPEVVVLGLILCGGDGVQLIKEFRKQNPAVAILVVTPSEDPTSIRRALRAGARGYLRICDGHLEFLTALDKICAGDRYVSKGLMPMVFSAFAIGNSKPVVSATNILSDRELEVFSLIGRGFGVSQLARELSVSVKTVETHEMRIKQKLGLRRAAELREKATDWAIKSDWRRMLRHS